MKGLGFLAFAPVFLAVVGLVVMGLWNALIPSLFAGPVLGFWQAVGLLLLCRILFGGFRRVGPGGWGHHHRGHRAWKARWHRMTPEERERFRDSFRRWKDMSREQRRQFRRGFRGCGPRTVDPQRPDSAEPGQDVRGPQW
jgi:uncharacterized protein DUF3106